MLPIASGCGCLELELLGLFPGEALVGAEVAVLGGLQVDRAVQAELADNDTRSQVKVLADDLDELIRGLGGGAVGLDEDGEGLGDTNSVRELDKGSTGKAGVDQRLGDPAGDVGSGSVDLGEVLAGESTTTMGTPATVGVDNDLTTSQTSITLGTTDDKEARGLDLIAMLVLRVIQQRIAGAKTDTYVVDGLVIEVLGGDGLLDDLLQDLLAELLGGDIGGVLGRDDNGVDTLGDDSAVVVLVLNGDLGLGVGSQPRQRAVAAGGGHGSIELVGELEGQREQLRGLIGGIAEHDTLVTSTELLKCLLVVETLGNIG